jgi:hypothetical protein
MTETTRRKATTTIIATTRVRSSNKATATYRAAKLEEREQELRDNRSDNNKSELTIER